jgi:hypothetical protein
MGGRRSADVLREEGKGVKKEEQEGEPPRDLLRGSNASPPPPVGCRRRSPRARFAAQRERRKGEKEMVKMF